jgi:hypothetical protein
LYFNQMANPSADSIIVVAGVEAGKATYQEVATEFEKYKVELTPIRSAILHEVVTLKARCDIRRAASEASE